MKDFILPFLLLVANGMQLQAENGTIYLNNHYYTGKTWIAHLSPIGIERMYPIQTFVNVADSGSCILEMDIEKQYSRFLTREEL